jgi:DNA-binding NtrC family response regulator
VVLFGPSGSGKTFLAQRIHELSGRKGPYVELNCGRVPKDSTQFQSELLGHVKGAYTGAVIRRVGALFQADGGTLFLDEVESLPSEAQVFLLDLLEGKGELRPLGAEKGQPRPNVRFICATKVPLDESPLREDLVNRLVRGHRIVIPTLAERREDIPLLVANILGVMNGETGVEATLTDGAMAYLAAQSWPGHVRQLKDALYSATDGHQGERVVLGAKPFEDYLASEKIVRGKRKDRQAMVTEPRIEVHAAPPTAPMDAPRKRPVDLTKKDIEQALRAAGGVMKRAAELLGCSPTTLREKRREFGL